jgi:RES domain-containing protein
MLVYRISQTKYINDLSGEGARRYGGRWNRPGVPVLYTAQHLSLAVLELIVHFNAKDALMLPYSYISIDIPNDKLIKLQDTIFQFENIEANNENLWKTLDHYFLNGKTLGLIVPSIVIPIEYNVILNPLHMEYSSIKVIETARLNLDERLASSTQ